MDSIELKIPEYYIAKKSDGKEQIVKYYQKYSNDENNDLYWGYYGINSYHEIATSKKNIRELIKYLIKNLNPCISMQELLSWTKFLEDICPDCENTFEGTKAVIVPSVTPPANNTFDF